MVICFCFVLSKGVRLDFLVDENEVTVCIYLSIDSNLFCSGRYIAQPVREGVRPNQFTKFKERKTRLDTNPSLLAEQPYLQLYTQTEPIPMKMDVQQRESADERVTYGGNETKRTDDGWFRWYDHDQDYRFRRPTLHTGICWRYYVDRR